MITLFRQSFEQEYQLKTQLVGSGGPVNCLAFTEQGRFLASGGDDEKLRIWDVEGKRSFQIIGDDLGRWGQVTCVQWLRGFSEETLCFGTGRGLVLIYARNKDSEKFKEVSSTAVFPFNEPVESMDYDPHKLRLALSSHTGRLKVFQVERNGTLIPLWSRNWNDLKETKGVTPRSIYFLNKGDSLTLLGLESGAMIQKAAANGNDNWSKVLKSSIGNATLSADKKWLLVDNLSKGFDLYHFPHTSPTDSFRIPREKAFVHPGIFLEEQTSVACGSDHGKIYIFSLGTSNCLQKLKHGNRKTMVQVLDACSTPNGHLIASGTSDKKPEIIIWEKKRASSEPKRGGCDSLTIMILINILLILLFALLWFDGNGNGGSAWIRGYELARTSRRPINQVLVDAEDLLRRMEDNDHKWNGHV